MVRGKDRTEKEIGNNLCNPPLTGYLLVRLPTDISNGPKRERIRYPLDPFPVDHRTVKGGFQGDDKDVESDYDYYGNKGFSRTTFASNRE